MSLTDYANLAYCTNQETFENAPYLSKPALAFFCPVLRPSAAPYPKSYTLHATFKGHSRNTVLRARASRNLILVVNFNVAASESFLTPPYSD